MLLVGYTHKENLGLPSKHTGTLVLPNPIRLLIGFFIAKVGQQCGEKEHEQDEKEDEMLAFRAFKEYRRM